MNVTFLDPYIILPFFYLTRWHVNVAVVFEELSQHKPYNLKLLLSDVCILRL